MYIDEIFKNEYEFVKTLMKDYQVTDEEIGFQKGVDGCDDCIFIASEDNSINKSFWYFKGKSGRIIIVEETY